MYTDALIEAVRSLVNAYGAEATRRALEANRALLTSAEARELLALQLTRHEPTSREHRVIAARLAAIERAREVGAERAFSGYEAACEAIVALLAAADWDAVERVASQRQHDLLPEVADVAFADLVMQPSTDDELAHVLGGWSLVRRCREVGLEAAVAEKRRGYRGFVVDAETAAAIAGAGSVEELARVEVEDPDLARKLGRQAELQRQMEAWPGREEYLRAFEGLEPTDARAKLELAAAQLAAVDREALPLVWAGVARDLAAAHWDDASGAEAPDLREAIRLRLAAHEILDRKAEPDEYGRSQHRLGVAYLTDTAGSRRENTEGAIAAFEEALSVYRRAAEPVEWARTANNLAEALRRRASADRTADLDRAVELAEKAVATLEGREEPELLARTRVTLGAVLLERATGSPEENRRDAAAQFERALAAWRPGFGAEVAATANVGLGNLAWERSRSEPGRFAELLDEAEKRFRAALAVSQGASGLTLWEALAHQGLGLVSSDRLGAGATEHDAAVEHLEEALRLLAAAGAPPAQIGVLHHSLGAVHGERPDGDRAALEKAAAQFDRALSIFDAETHPAERRDTLRAFGSLAFRARRWQEAHDRWKEATAIARERLGGMISIAGRTAEARGDLGLFRDDAYCLLRLGRPADALERLDQGMARMLTESLSLQAAAASAEPADERSVAWALAEIRRIEDETRAPAVQADPERAAHLGQRLRDAHRHLAGAIGANRRPAPDLAALLAAIPAGGAAVAPVITSHGGAALVVAAGTEAVTSRNVVDLPRLGLDALSAILGGWLDACLRWAAADGEEDPAELMDALAEVLERLDEALLEPVRRRLEELGVAKGSPVVFLPQGWLSVLPVHAAAGRGAGRSFLDDYEVRFTPSLATLCACNARLEEPARAGASLLAVANPTLDLEYADSEVAAVVAAFGDRPHRVVAREAATREAVLAATPGRQYLHLACHGRFDWSDPRASGLELAGDDRLSLRDVLSPDADLASCRLVVLSACETGLTEIRTMPDEFVGMAGALLEAGAAGVVCSLWPVNDFATKLLMAELYRRHLAGAGVAAALRGAQLWLRDATAGELDLAAEQRRRHRQTGDAEALEAAEYFDEHPDERPFSDPYFWAAFTATGASRPPDRPSGAATV